MKTIEYSNFVVKTSLEEVTKENFFKSPIDIYSKNDEFITSISTYEVNYLIALYLSSGKEEQAKGALGAVVRNRRFSADYLEEKLKETGIL